MQCDYIRDTTDGLIVCCLLESGHKGGHTPDPAVKPGEMIGDWRRGGTGACSHTIHFFHKQEAQHA